MHDLTLPNQHLKRYPKFVWEFRHKDVISQDLLHSLFEGGSTQRFDASSSLYPIFQLCICKLAKNLPLTEESFHLILEFNVANGERSGSDTV